MPDGCRTTNGVPPPARVLSHIAYFFYSPPDSVASIQGCSNNRLAAHRSSGLHANIHLTNTRNSSFSSPVRFDSEDSSVRSGISGCAIHRPLHVNIRRAWDVLYIPSPSKNSDVREEQFKKSKGGGPNIAIISAR